MGEEFDIIEKSFLKLQYPLNFINRAKKKALKIHNKKNNITSPNNTQHNNNNDFDRYIILPNNPLISLIK